MTLTSANLEPTGDPVEEDDSSGKVDVAGRSPFRLAMARFRKDRLSMIAFYVVALFVIVAILAPVLAYLGVLNPNKNYPEVLAGGDGYFPGGWYGVSLKHPLGVEPGAARDLFSRVVLGLTLSMSIAVSGAIITVAIGTVMGIISGFAGGITDAVVGRIIDLTLAVPSTLMLLALSQVVVDRMRQLHWPEGPNGAIVNGSYVVLVLAAFGWPPVARLIRGQVLSLREREFVDAAILMGASRPRIYFKEILPNLWAPLLVYFTLLLPAYVSAEAALSYLGVGIQEPTPTLGNVLNSALNFLQGDPVYFFSPAILIALLVISFNLLGDGARDALDPKSSG